MSLKLPNQKRALKVNLDEYRLLMYKRKNKIPLDIRAGSLTFFFRPNGEIASYEIRVKPQEGQRIVIQRISQFTKIGPRNLASRNAGQVNES